MHRYLIGQKIFTILRMLIFPATEICAELCCQCTRFEWSYVANLLCNIFPNFLPNFRLKRGN